MRDCAHLSRRARRGALDCIQATDVGKLGARLDYLSAVLDNVREEAEAREEEELRADEQAHSEAPLDTSEYHGELTLRQHWRLATAPISEDNFETLAAAGMRGELLQVPTVPIAEMGACPAARLDEEARWIDDCRRAELALGKALAVPALDEGAYASPRAEVVTKLHDALKQDIAQADLCERCRKPKSGMPCHKVCEDCFGAGRPSGHGYGYGSGSRYEGYYDDYDDEYRVEYGSDYSYG
jgi:hypothetical protein